MSKPCGPLAALEARLVDRVFVRCRTESRGESAHNRLMRRAHPILSLAEGQALAHELEVVRRSNLRLSRQLTRLKRTATLVRHQAGHDPLTGLANRSLLFDRLEQAFIRAARSAKQVAVLLLDLDGFKNVNDRFGHAAGDELLRKVARRLSDCVRAADTICRYGGDEFVIVLPDVESAEIATVADLVAQKIRTCLALPYTIDHTVLGITVSVGIAIYCNTRQSSVELLPQTDAAMYRAKNAVREAGLFGPKTACLGRLSAD